MNKLQLTNLLKLLFILTSILMTLSACVTLSLVSPSISYNNNYGGASNPNQIFCTQGSFFKSAFCTIPLSRFVAISSNNADMLESNALVNYAVANNSFIFNDLTQVKVLTMLNTQIQESETSERYQHLPESVKKMYGKLQTKYIPEKNYAKQADAYIYIYALNTIDFATSACPNAELESSVLYSAKEYQQQQQFMLYKAFSMQFTNAVLMHIADSVDGKYKNEADLFESLYAEILELDPVMLRSLAIQAYNTSLNAQPKFERSFYTREGIRFTRLGNFSCTKDIASWHRYAYEFFGLNVSGVRDEVHFKTSDVFLI